MELIVTTAAQLQDVLVQVLEAYEETKQKEKFSMKTFNTTEVAKILNLHPATITGMIKKGLLKTTTDGQRIPGSSILDYTGAIQKPFKIR